jgi:hypothetical protein
MLASTGVNLKRKEVTNMTYSKPELVLMADARFAIQSDDGGTAHKEEVNGEGIPSRVQTPGAYEADE